MNKISIIIPVFNGEEYLTMCIKALLNQTYKNNEYIFINDGSTDNSLKILRDYEKKDDRIIVIDKENTGVSDSRNIGIKKASGDYICFCDADDIYVENYLEVMFNLIKENNVDAVRCNFKVIDKNGKIIDRGNDVLTNKKLSKEDIVNKMIPGCLSGKIPCFTYLLMIKKDCLNVSFPLDVAMMEDVVFYIKLLLNIDSFYITGDTLYTIMFNENGATNNVKNYKRNINNVILVNKYIRDILKEANLLTDENIEKLNVNHLNAIADFIFKHYLYGEKTIDMCKKMRDDMFSLLIKETDLSCISMPRRILLKLINHRHYVLLKIYFVLRKLVFSMKRGRL